MKAGENILIIILNLLGNGEESRRAVTSAATQYAVIACSGLRLSGLSQSMRSACWYVLFEHLQKNRAFRVAAPVSINFGFLLSPRDSQCTWPLICIRREDMSTSDGVVAG
jgi:hypothetical protein